MQKSSIILLVAGGLIIGGIALSIWSNQVIFEDFAKKENQLVAGESMMVQIAMSESQKGVYAVEVLELKKDTITATVTDPLQNQILQQTVDKEAFEGYFDVTVSGNYTLQVQNQDTIETFVAGYIGPEPDSTKRVIAFVSIYILIIGLISIVIAIVYSIIEKKRNQLR